MKLGLTFRYSFNEDETFTHDTFKELLDVGRRIIEVTSGNGKFHHYFEQNYWETHKTGAGSRNNKGKLVDPSNRQPVESEKDVTAIITELRKG